MERQKYILTEDTFSAVERLKGEELSAGLKSEIDKYFISLISWVQRAYPGNEFEVLSFKENQIDGQLSSKVQEELKANPNTIIVCLDRFLLKNLEKEYPDRFTRLQITRALKGGKTSRQTTPPLSVQFDNLAEFVENRDIILADDGIFSGGTSNYVAEELEKRGISKDRVKKFIGFIGNNINVEGVATEQLSPIENLYEWVDIRDFSIFGGKKYEASKNNGVATSVPYIYPWSDGSGASFDKIGNFFEISKGLITAFQKLIGKIEIETGKTLLIKDLVKSSFPIPTNIQKNIPTTINTSVTEYLNECINFINKEKEREVYVFDMDGTLYQLDGANNGFTGSTLEGEINKRAISFIIKTEKISISKAVDVFKEGLSNKIGLSAFLSKRYGITRSEYFDNVWDIDPEGIIKNFNIPVNKIKEISTTGKKLILLTSAPRVWQEKVIKYLGIGGLFESIYTGEDFGTKEEIFAMLSERYIPNRMVSIGDQENTDIIPAQKYGIKGLLIKNPEDLQK